MEYDDLSPSQRIRRNRVYLSFVIAVSHFVLALLGIINRLSYTVPTRYALLQQTLTNPLWIFLHLFCSLAIVITISKNKGQVTALGSATGVMGAWAFLSLLWGMTTLTPVSLAGPVLGGVFALMSYFLTISWARAPSVHERGE